MTNGMHWTSAASGATDLDLAISEAARLVREQMDGRPIDLLVAFVSAQHAARHEDVPAAVIRELSPGTMIGCTAAGVIGGGRELEQQAGVSLTAASLPGVELTPAHVGKEAIEGAAQHDDEDWRSLLGLDPDADPAGVVLLVDPFSCNARGLIGGIERTFPRAPLIGGLVSGGEGPLANALFIGDRVVREGAVILSMSGDVAVDTIVAQGCRPIDRPRFVTRCRGNVVFELDSQPALSVLRATYEAIPAEEQKLFQRSLFVGIAMRDQTEEFGIGDFIIRNLLGVDPKAGALVLAAAVEQYTVVQLHVRDARTSAEELSRLLIDYREALDVRKPGPSGALIFSCLGRGKALYGVPNHDIDLVGRQLGPIALGGFFCNGEIGPVRGKTFLHGYTTSFGLFRSP